MPATGVYYKVERIILGSDGSRTERKGEVPYLIAADSAPAAARRFVDEENATLVGSIADLPGDKATATAANSRQTFVIFVERGTEAFRP